jgi:hypothetical protein
MSEAIKWYTLAAAGGSDKANAELLRRKIINE